MDMAETLVEIGAEALYNAANKQLAAWSKPWSALSGRERDHFRHAAVAVLAAVADTWRGDKCSLG